MTWLFLRTLPGNYAPTLSFGLDTGSPTIEIIHFLVGFLKTRISNVESIEVEANQIFKVQRRMRCIFSDEEPP